MIGMGERKTKRKGNDKNVQNTRKQRKEKFHVVIVVIMLFHNNPIHSCTTEKYVRNRICDVTFSFDFLPLTNMHELCVKKHEKREHAELNKIRHEIDKESFPIDPFACVF